MPDPLVFLPGMMCDARLFGPQLPILGRDRAVMVAPLTGHETIGDLATAVLAAAPSRFALAGLSMGGIVAMEVMARAPERVSRLALMDTNFLAEAPEVAAQREHHMAAARSGALLDIMREEMKPRYLAPGPRRPEVLRLVMDMAASLGPDVFVAQSRALQRRPDQSETLKSVRVPTMLLCGAHDALCPVSRHQTMANLIQGATLVVVPDAGHLPTLEQPDAVIEALSTWLNGPAL